MKILLIFVLMFVYACNGETPKKVTPPESQSMSALDHLKRAKQILRGEEGHLMIQGRGLTDAETKRYEVLLSSSKILNDLIESLQSSELR